MANPFKRLFKRLIGGNKTARTPAEEARIRQNQRDLAKQVGNVPGVKIPGVSPAEAARLRQIEQERQRSRRVTGKIREGIGKGPSKPIVTYGWTQWYPMNSSNVDRIRYLDGHHLCQCVFKNGRLYQYEGVEPIIFAGWLRSHSPGQYQWYVLRAYGYRYTELSRSMQVSPPRDDVFAGEPFAVPAEIEQFQRSRGRAAVDLVPVAQGFAPPPNDAWRQFRR